MSLFLYGILAMPLAFASMPLYIHAPDFYTTQFGVSLATLGALLLALRLVDAVQDPLIGYMSDRFQRYRLPVMLLAATLLVTSFTALFQLPEQSWALPWFATHIFLATTSFSVLSINLNMLGGMWIKDENAKTRISSVREALGLVGLLLAVISPSVLMQFYSPAFSFLIVSGLLAAAMLVAATCFMVWYKRYDSHHNKNDVAFASFFSVFSIIPKPTKLFFAVYGISMLASSIPALLVLFYIRDRLDAEQLTGLFLALYFLSGAAGMPLWSALSRKFGKYNAWGAAMLLAIITFIWAYFLGQGDVWQYGVICVLSGIAFGADLSLPPSILADHIHQMKEENRASSLYGLLTFLAKAALAFASFITLPLLDYVGYRPAMTNTEQALIALSLAYALIPCVIKIGSVFLLWKLGGYHVQNTFNTHHTTHA